MRYLHTKGSRNQEFESSVTPPSPCINSTTTNPPHLQVPLSYLLSIRYYKVARTSACRYRRARDTVAPDSARSSAMRAVTSLRKYPGVDHCSCFVHPQGQAESSAR